MDYPKMKVTRYSERYSDAWWIATEEHTELLAHVSPWRDDGEQLARLFAAAPEMFEALESVIVASAGWHDSEDCRIEGRTDCEMCAALRDARAALAAAKPQGGE